MNETLERYLLDDFKKNPEKAFQTAKSNFAVASRLNKKKTALPVLDQFIKEGLNWTVNKFVIINAKHNLLTPEQLAQFKSELAQ